MKPVFTSVFDLDNHLKSTRIDFGGQQCTPEEAEIAAKMAKNAYNQLYKLGFYYQGDGTFYSKGGTIQQIDEARKVVKLYEGLFKAEQYGNGYEEDWAGNTLNGARPNGKTPEPKLDDFLSPEFTQAQQQEQSKAPEQSVAPEQQTQSAQDRLNANIDQVLAKLDELQENNDSLNARIETLTEQVKQLKTENQNLRTELRQVRERNTKLENELWQREQRDPKTQTQNQQLDPKMTYSLNVFDGRKGQYVNIRFSDEKQSQKYMNEATRLGYQYVSSGNYFSKKVAEKDIQRELAHVEDVLAKRGLTRVDGLPPRDRGNEGQVIGLGQ